MSQPTPTYLGLDLETTGLDPEHDLILEIGVLILGDDLTEITRFDAPIAHETHAIMTRINDYVRDMHTQNGLLSELDAGKGIPLEQSEQTLHLIIDAYPERPVLLGSSVHFDRGFLRVHMPRIVERLSHRHCDASSFAMFAPQLRAHGGAAHRALADVRHSAQMCRDARAMLRRMPPRKAGR